MPVTARRRRRPGGGQPNLRWIVGAAETAPLGGPYALVTAAASVHWMSWKETMSRLTGVMTGNAVLAVIEHGPVGQPWEEALIEVIVRHSRSAGFDPAAPFIADAIAAEGLLDITGRTSTRAVAFRQSVSEYVEQFHSTSSLARKWMPGGESAAFDRGVRDVVAPYVADGMLELQVVARLAWGRPVRL